MKKAKQTKYKSKESGRRIYFYNGADPREVEISCMNNSCGGKLLLVDKEHLQACNHGCNTFHFCSKDCAKEKQNHNCQKIKKLRSDIEVLQQNADLMMLLCDPSQVGNINKRRHPVAFAYIWARFELANELASVAEDHRTRTHRREAISIMQDCLRLCNSHLGTSPKAWSHQFATCLMHSGRLGNALSFLAFAIERNIPSTEGKALNICKSPVEGTWIYPSPANNSFTSEACRNGDLYLIFVLYITKLKQLLALTLMRQSMQYFRKTLCYRMIEGLEADGPMCILLEYLLPWRFNNELVTWDSLLQHCEYLHSEVVIIAKIIQERNPHLLMGIKSLKKNGNNKYVSIKSSSPASKQYAIACINKCSYSLLTMPDLDVWMKYYDSVRKCL